MPRLFAGLQLPPQVCVDLADLPQPLPSTRWLPMDDYHITLRFFGDITPPEARELTANLAAISFDPFTLRLVGLGTFGGNNPRTLFASVEPSPALSGLAQAVETAARRAGLPPETRRFAPHVTLARLSAPPVAPLARYLGHHGGFRTPPFLVTQFDLLSAKPNTGGGPYVVEQTFQSSLGVIDDADWNDADHDQYSA